MSSSPEADAAMRKVFQAFSDQMVCVGMEIHEGATEMAERAARIAEEGDRAEVPTETMTQEALLDLIYAYGDAQVRASLAASGRVAEARREAAHEAHQAVLDAVRSLPIEAGR
jgi:hypothetical protein